MGVTELVLLRHGQTIWHTENRYAGRSDVALAPHGEAQADELARWASKAELDAVLTSPLARAQRTAAPTCDATGLAPVVDERLVEIDFGEGEGLTREEMTTRFPQELEAFLAAPATVALPRGETGAAAVARARPVLDQACRAHPDGRVLIVAHQTLLRLLLCDHLEIPLDRYRAVFPRLEPTARTVLIPAPAGPAALLGLNVRG